MTLKVRLVLSAVLLGLLASLTGCAAVQGGTKAQAAGGFMESAQADGLGVTLAIEPVKPGENRFLVTLNQNDVSAVEAQVIMATMGHGAVVDLNQTAPGKWEVSSGVIDMEGRWMIRVKSTLTSGTEKTATFHLVVK